MLYIIFFFIGFRYRTEIKTDFTVLFVWSAIYLYKPKQKYYVCTLLIVVKSILRNRTCLTYYYFWQWNSFTCVVEIDLNDILNPMQSPVQRF